MYLTKDLKPTEEDVSPEQLEILNKLLAPKFEAEIELNTPDETAEEDERTGKNHLHRF